MATATGGGLSIQLLLQAAEFLERQEREAEHGCAPLAPGGKDREAVPRQVKARRSGGGRRSARNEMEKNRRAQLRLCMERLEELIRLGPDAGKHTTLALLTQAKLHIKKLEEAERRAIHQLKQLRREQRHLRRQLEKLGVERMRMDSCGSAASSKPSHSDQEEVEVDAPSPAELPADLDWSSSSPSDSDGGRSLRSGRSDEGYSSTSGTQAKPQNLRKTPFSL